MKRTPKRTPPRTTEKVHTTEYAYTAVFEHAAEGGYVVSVPALPGVVTQGETLVEARAMVKDAIRGYLQALRKHGEKIPTEIGRAVTERVVVSLARA